jgi:peptide-methionine (S)-S-oxide reductase
VNKTGNTLKTAVTLVAAVFFISACGQNNQKQNNMNSGTTEPAQKNQDNPGPDVDTATFGAGCFWCVEAIFERLIGVLSVESGYSGGHVKDPTYNDVCAGNTGHAEVIRLTYDKTKISFDELLEVFWKTHDPTTPGRQGNDVGTQYRSVVFYHNDDQKRIAMDYKQKLNAEKVYPDPIITEISPLSNYYPAEDYHQDYYDQNDGQSYCRYVIQPKLEKFEKIFKERLKK